MQYYSSVTERQIPFKMSLRRGLNLPQTFNFEVTLFMLDGKKHLLSVC